MEFITLAGAACVIWGFYQEVKDVLQQLRF